MIKGFVALGVIAAATALAAPGGVVRAQEVSTSYKRTQRDPFIRYKPAPAAKRKAEPTAPAVTVASAPTIQARIAQYKAQKMAAMNAQQPVPKPTTALLLEEINVTGIFRTPRGYAAMVEATPIKLSYVIYPGEVFYDGSLVAVEENNLVFRRERKLSDGRRDVMVETKPLRQPNAVEDSMTANKAPAAPAATPPSSKDRGSKEDTASVSGN